MRKQFMILILAITAVTVKAQFSDTFDDGDFTQNPTWEGDSVNFEVNASGQLHLLASGADTSVLVTANGMISNTEWNFWVKLSFNTSANNFARIYLVSDNASLKGPLNGYFLQIGGSSDSIFFFRQNGNNTEKLFRGNFACTNHSTNVFRLKMIHDSTGRWTLYSDNSGGMNYTEEGHCVETGFSSTAWFGIYCHYTASNSTKFYFDDFYTGPIRVDTLPPAVDSLTVTDSTNMAIAFSENVEVASAGDVHHYFSKTNGNPLAAIPDASHGNKVRITFQQPFPDETNDTLVVTGIRDLAGNTIVETRVPFSNHKVRARDIIMDEIMADPEPVTRLPESEYVELYNRTSFPLNLKGWTFDYGTSVKTLPGVSISPHGYLILTKGISLNYYGNCVDLFTSYSTLSNEGATLVLRNASGSVIHSVTYTSRWYQDPLKENGGWSLEMIDPENPCGCPGNWKASADAKGGTPGAVNSVHAANPDIVRPYLQRASVLSDSTLEIRFSEPMDSSSIRSENQWSLDGDGSVLGRISAVPPAFETAIFLLPNPLKKKHTYLLSCKDLPYDCVGNPLDTTNPVRVGLADSVLAGDLVINEILAYPYTGGEKFIEIFNRSAKILDLEELALGVYDSIQNLATDLKPITAGSLISFPGDYSVLTKDPEDIQKRYSCPNPDSFVPMETLPSLNSDKGVVVLARIRDGNIIDRVSYSQSMYPDLLTTSRGISLERINPVFSSEDNSNWHAAAESCGFATPGYRNSDFMQMSQGKDLVTLTPSVFTPDDDGNEDVLGIGFSLDCAGYLATVSIFDAAGFRIRVLAENRMLSADDGMIWDGRDEKNQKSPVGIYILYVEFMKPEGKMIKVKKTVVLGGRR